MLLTGFGVPADRFVAIPRNAQREELRTAQDSE